MKRFIYIFEVILLLFIAFYRFILVEHLLELSDLILVIFIVGSAFLLRNELGLRKDRSLVKSNSIQIVFIMIMLFVLIGYLSGLHFGFLKNAYSLKFFDIIRNVTPIILLICSQEVIRYMVVKKSIKDNKPVIFLTILYILLDVAMTCTSANLASGLKFFIYITNSFLPSVARHILCSYLCNHVSYVPGLILRLFFGVYVYVAPIFPDYGYYIGSVVGVLIPYIIYIIVSKYVQYAEKVKLPTIKKGLWYVNIPLLIVMLFIVGLVSGVFRYQIMAIGSGSMEPIYYMGDAVIFEKIELEEQSVIEKGMIICYKHGAKYVTHRVVDIVTKDSEMLYQTKGDNNKENDEYLVNAQDVVGIVKLRIKSIGWPTIWFQELIS